MIQETITNGCPGRGMLQRMLRESLSEVEYSKVAEHVEACPRCQVELDGLTACDGWGCLLDALNSGRQESAARGHLPETVGGFRIIEEIGRGGQGVVYRALQTRLHRYLAVKTPMLGILASAADRTRFRREAEAMAKVTHPNVVPILTVDEHDGVPYFAMELLEGGSLAQRLESTPWETSRAVDLVGQLASAVHAAHERDIIHRDLKPSNVLFTCDGTPKITDFGIAKRIGVDTLHTASNAILGTPGYLAPEQAGQSATAGRAADVYSLGAILYTLVAARPPFVGATPYDTLTLICSHDPAPPSRLNPKVDRDLDTIILKCLEKNPGRRYDTAAALAADLARFRNREPIAARRTGPVVRTWRWCCRRPLVAGLLVTLASTVLGGIVGMSVLWRQAVRNAAEADRFAEDVSLAAIQVLETSKGLALKPLVQEERRNLLAAAAILVRQANKAKPGVAMATRAGSTLLLLAEASFQLGDAADAVEIAEEAATWLEKGRTFDAKNWECRYSLVRAYDRIGHYTRNSGGFPASLEWFATACDEADALVRDFKDSDEHTRALGLRAVVLCDTARSLQDLERFAECETYLWRALPDHRIVAERYGDDPQRLVRLAGNLSALADLYRETGRLDEAEPLFREAVEITKRLWHDYPEQPLHWRDMQGPVRDLGLLYLYSWRFKEAEELLDLRYAMARELEVFAPAEPGPRLGVAGAMADLARVRRSLGETDEANALADGCIERLRNFIATYPKYSDGAHVTLAWSLLMDPRPEVRNPEESLELVRIQLELRDGVAYDQMAVGAARYRLGEFEEAIDLLRDAQGRRPELTGLIGFFLAMSYARKGEIDSAVDSYEDAVRWTTKQQPSNEELLRLRDEADEVLGKDVRVTF